MTMPTRCSDLRYIVHRQGDYLLLDSSPSGETGGGRAYDVAQDGQRFLMITVGRGVEDTSAPPSLILVQNWHEELKRLVPVD